MHLCAGQPSNAELAAVLDSLSTPDRKALNGTLVANGFPQAYDFNAGSARGVQVIGPATLAGFVWDSSNCGMSQKAQFLYSFLTTLLMKSLPATAGGVSQYWAGPGATPVGYASPNGFGTQPTGYPYIPVFGPPAREVPDDMVYLHPMTGKMYTNDGGSTLMGPIGTLNNLGNVGVIAQPGETVVLPRVDGSGEKVTVVVPNPVAATPDDVVAYTNDAIDYVPEPAVLPPSSDIPTSIPDLGSTGCTRCTNTDPSQSVVGEPGPAGKPTGYISPVTASFAAAPAVADGVEGPGFSIEITWGLALLILLIIYIVVRN